MVVSAAAAAAALAVLVVATAALIAAGARLVAAAAGREGGLHLLLGGGVRKAVGHATNADLLAGPGLVADIDRRGRVVPDQHHVQRRNHPPGQKAFDRLLHLAPNGGGSRVNQYSVIMDIKFPTNRTSFNSFTSLFQTNPNPFADDGDCFINGANGIGISGDYGDPTNVRFNAGQWQRIALVVDITSPSTNATYKSYVNGVLQNQVQVPGSWTIDGRYALRDTFLVFADNSNEVASGYINSMQLRNYAMTDAELAALGGPSATGIPIPVEGDVNRDGCVDDSDLLAVLFNFGATDPCIALEDLNRDGTVDDADLLLVLFNFGSGC